MTQPMATHARPTPLATAVRRVVVTPTFAAGLGVVIAAGMAYPMTKTVLSYGGTPPAGGGSCLTPGCVGELATARPGQRLATPPPAANSPDPSAAPAPSGGGTVAAGPPPVMQYQTLRQWQSGFFGQVTITDTGGSAQANWQLHLSYDSAHIIGVWGGKWTASGDHTVIVTPDTGDGTGGSSSVQVVLAVSGRAGPPSSCEFNGRACQMGQTGDRSQTWDSPSHQHEQSQPSGGQQGGFSGR
jgi:cellulose binding protein with CBM2 domain